MQKIKHTEFDEYKYFLEYKKTKNQDLKEKIVEHYLYIAEILSRRFQNRGVEYEDIYQVACVGLILSVDRFDPEKKIKFVSYATPTVLGEIRRYFRDKGYFIKIPRTLYNVFYRAEKIRRSMNDEKYSYKDLSRIMNIPEDIVTKAYEVGGIAFIQSLEQEAYADGNLMYIDTIGHDDNSFLMIENKDFISSCMNSLTNKEQEFIKLRFYKNYTQKQISELWNLSQMQISRMEKKILQTLKKLYFK